MSCIWSLLHSHQPLSATVFPSSPQVEGTCDGRYGFILLVTQLQDPGPGVIREGTGGALYGVSYNAITFMPHNGEVMDTRVTTVNKVSVWKRWRQPASGGGGGHGHQRRSVKMWKGGGREGRGEEKRARPRVAQHVRSTPSGHCRLPCVGRALAGRA